MGFNNSDRRADVTAEPSPGSPRVLPRRARALIEGALGYLGDLAQGLASLTDLARWGLERMDGSAPPAADRGPETPAVDLGITLRVEELAECVTRLESAVEALAPIPVSERRRGVHPCSVCGGRVVLVLEGAPRGPGDWFNGLCAGCRTFASTTPDSEVLP